MSTVLTDRTLSYMNINQKFADKEALLNYINGVFSCGADYVEINSGLLELLDGEDLSEKYILQICSVKDIKLCVDHKFAYVSIPADLSVFFDKLSVFQNIIAEVQSDKYSIISELLDHKEHDHGTVCASEQSIIVEKAMEEKVLDEAKRQGFYLMDDEQAKRLAGLLFHPGGALNPKVVGKTAADLAKMAGFSVFPPEIYLDPITIS